MISHICFKHNSFLWISRSTAIHLLLRALPAGVVHSESLYSLSFSVHWPVIRLLLLSASFGAKQTLISQGIFPTYCTLSAMPRNKTTPVATQTSFSQVNRRHSSFTLASLTPSPQQPNESDRHAAPRVAQTSSSSHLVHSDTVYAAATQVRHGTERVYAETQVWATGGSTSFLCDGSHTVFTVQN
jgi:hypothetical protein